MSTTRINDLRKRLKRDNLDGMIITHLDHIRYLTGFTGSAGLLVIGPKGADFFTDFRYTDQSRKQVRGAKVSIIKRDPVDCLKDFPRLNARHRRYGFAVEAQRRRAVHYLDLCMCPSSLCHGLYLARSW